MNSTILIAQKRLDYLSTKVNNTSVTFITVNNPF